MQNLNQGQEPSPEPARAVLSRRGAVSFNQSLGASAENLSGLPPGCRELPSLIGGVSIFCPAALRILCAPPLTLATALILVLFWPGTWLCAADESNDPLWRKAVAIATANADWVPGLVITRSEVLHKGDTVGVHEIWQRSKPGAKGEVVTETVKILEDGKDVTIQEKAKNEAQSGTKKGHGKGGGNPFDASVQDRLSLKVMDQARTIAGRECAGYGFELRSTNGPTSRGTAWLEKETGIPREIENMTLDPLPDKHLKHLSVSTRYETMTDGSWVAREMTTTSTISVMFIKADARTTTTFSEHWKKPPP